VAAPGGRGVVDVRINEAELARLTRSASGPVVMAMARLGERATQLAKAAAPVGDRSSKTPEGHPSGWLRSQIGWRLSIEGGQIVVDVISPAVTSPASVIPGDPYALYIERPELRVHHGGPDWLYAKDGPYLEPSVHRAIAEVFG
jgi:hypothetical protein